MSLRVIEGESCPHCKSSKVLAGITGAPHHCGHCDNGVSKHCEKCGEFYFGIEEPQAHKCGNRKVGFRAAPRAHNTPGISTSARVKGYRL